MISLLQRGFVGSFLVIFWQFLPPPIFPSLFCKFCQRFLIMAHFVHLALLKKGYFLIFCKFSSHIYPLKDDLPLDLKNFVAPFYRYGSTVPRLQIHFKETVTFYLLVPMTSWYSFGQPWNDKRLIQPWSTQWF